jgi:hypothetical protein
MNVRYRSLPLFLLLALLLTTLLLARPFAVFSEETLFEPAAAHSQSAVTFDSVARRSRPVTVNWAALTPQTTQLKLDLFDDVVLTAVRQRVDISPAVSGYVWVGRVLGDEDSHVTLSVRDHFLAGSVSLHGVERYAIRYHAASGTHVVREIDPAAYAEPAASDYIIPEAVAAPRMPTAACEDGSKIDLMVAYTATARDSQGGTAAMEALINQRISDMNSANDNSQVPFDFNLVAVLEVAYTESGSISRDLERLVSLGDDYLDEVHVARDASKADLVGLYVAEGNEGTCGKAFMMNPAVATFEDRAFGVSALDYPDPYNCNPLTLAHEFGHNMGNAHDRANSNSSEPPHLPYAYGYNAPDRAFRTIMAFDCPDGGCPRINYWSNPDVFYGGQPTGIDYETSPEEAADEARAIAEVAQIVANFRSTCVIPATDTPTPSPTASATATATSVVPTATIPPSVTPSATATVFVADTPSPSATIAPSPTWTATAVSLTGSPSPTTAAVESPTATQPNATIPATPTILPPFFHAYVPFAMRP